MTQFINRYSRDHVSNKVAAKRRALAAEQRAIKRSVNNPGTFVFNPSFRESDLDRAASAGAGVGSIQSKEQLHYTGDKVIGVSLMHKSNLVPVFNYSEAEEIAHMRR